MQYTEADGFLILVISQINEGYILADDLELAHTLRMYGFDTDILFTREPQGMNLVIKQRL